MRTNFYNGVILGPLLKEDAAVLQGIIRATSPKTLVEFGYFRGDSARAMLSVMEDDAILHSYDNTQSPNISDTRFRFHHESQDAIEGIQNIDFVFLDASHDLELNKKTFLKIKDCMSPKAILAIHDTGTWIGGNIFNAEMGMANAKGEWIHCPDEIRFVNWLADEFPQWHQIHLHSSRSVRHGITILQKFEKLSLE